MGLTSELQSTGTFSKATPRNAVNFPSKIDLTQNHPVFQRTEKLWFGLWGWDAPTQDSPTRCCDMGLKLVPVFSHQLQGEICPSEHRANSNFSLLHLQGQRLCSTGRPLQPFLLPGVISLDFKAYELGLLTQLQKQCRLMRGTPY